ncbi:MAG: transcriptional regulator, IclR family [Acidimicrobiaceae bacterium]|jgi:IclR family acetate operon transcriptional repressor|nr:transcriptional regulator, IclR family [Acidimicrobiaceae bacterium]
MPAPTPPDRYTVRSVQRALRVLEIVSSEPVSGMSLTEISQALGASKSTTLATARTLTAHGILRSIDPGPRYKLGTALIRYGDLASQQSPIGEVCLPILREVSAATGMTARMALAEQGYPVCIERIDGPGTIRFHAPLGRREPPHATAAGKAMLAMLSEERVSEICRETGLRRHTAHTITDVATLFVELDAVRRRGYAVDDEEEVDGVFCIGAPFFDHNGACAGAISVTGIKHDLPGWKLAEMGRLIGHHADEVSKLLGGPGFLEVSSRLSRVTGAPSGRVEAER